jgi:hypothetical protein
VLKNFKMAYPEEEKKNEGKLGKNEEGIPQFFLKSKIITPILPRILKL